MAATKKIVFVGTEEDMGEDLFAALQDLGPGMLYLQFGDTPEGYGMYACNEPFTFEEAEKQFVNDFDEEVDDDEYYQMDEIDPESL